MPANWPSEWCNRAMATTDKIFRDPLFNYVAIKRPEDQWLIDLLDCPEVQRLRRIHQLGVSHFTYPGADHSRFSHTLGVLNMMQQALHRVDTLPTTGPAFSNAQSTLLAAAILHDVGHGPFSHLVEQPLGFKHEEWSVQIVTSEDTAVHQVLSDPQNDVDPQKVAALISKDSRNCAPWQKALLSSELDVDRLDYLRRDSYFTGSGYGHYDWYRILNTFEFYENEDGMDVLAWPQGAIYAIEEYIFARFYMYTNVYQHKTTRGFEKLLHAAWHRAKQLHGDGEDAGLVSEAAQFLDTQTPTIAQYLALEDATMVYQLRKWTCHPDRALSDLARRFLNRDGFAAIDDPVQEADFGEPRTAWESALQKLVESCGYSPPECYALRDDLKLTVYDPYMPEKEREEQDPYNAIMVRPKPDGTPQEISSLLEKRLGLVTGVREKQYRYYVPKEVRHKAHELAQSQKW